MPFGVGVQGWVKGHAIILDPSGTMRLDVMVYEDTKG